MKFSNKDFFSKCDQIRRKLWIWSHLLKKPLMENFIFCAVFRKIFSFIAKSDETESIVFSMSNKNIELKAVSSESELVPKLRI